MARRDAEEQGQGHASDGWPATPLGVRWTIGDMSHAGYDVLRASVWGARRCFGADARYLIAVNSVPLAQARAWAGDLPAEVTWRDVTDELAAEVAGYIDGGATEGTAWKLAPLRAFPDRHELVLDNDCVLWREPPAIAVWRFSQEACLLAADLRPCFGQFARWCGRQALNAGIRGLPPSFDFGAAVRRVLTGHPVALRSEVDEQGLVVAALSTPGPPIVVPLDDVTICSPLSMHQHHLGRCGAHFVGVNGQRSMWRMDGRPLHEHFHRHWHTHRAAVRDLVGLGLRPRE